MLQGNVLLVHPISHGIATEIHEGGGLEQRQSATLDAGLGHITITAVFKNNIGRLCKSVQYHIACIVAGVPVFIARISQTDN